MVFLLIQQTPETFVKEAAVWNASGHSGITCTMGAIAPEPTWWSCQGHPWDQASATNRPEEGRWQWWIRNNRNTRSKWIRSCHFDGWFMFYTNLYRSLQLFTDLNSMWFTRKSGFPQPHQVPAAFACPRALPGNIPVIKDSLDCEEIVSLSMVRWHTWSRYIQILLALRMLRSESFMPGSRCLQHPRDFNTSSHRFWCSALQRSRQPTLTVLNSSSELRWLCQILGPSCIQAQLVGKKNGRRYDCPNLWSLDCAVKEDSNYI